MKQFQKLKKFYIINIQNCLKTMPYIFYFAQQPQNNMYYNIPTLIHPQNLPYFLTTQNQTLLSFSIPPIEQKQSLTSCFITTGIKNQPQITCPSVSVLSGETIMKKKRRKNHQKQIQSAKKNSESNIVNQLYSFFNNNDKSQKIVVRGIKMLKKSPNDLQILKSIFYNTMKLLNIKRGRKYINKGNIVSLYSATHFSEEVPEVLDKLREINIINIQELCFLFRICTFNFLRSEIQPALLSSKRISKVARTLHLQRNRKIIKAIIHS